MNSRPYVAPPDSGLDLLHIDDALLVVNKPSGLLSVPGRGVGKDDCLVSRVQAVYPEVLSVHRLDMETSGLMVLKLAASFSSHPNTRFFLSMNGHGCVNSLAVSRTSQSV
jgi:tRNA pseudouridine32 synthase/23S rRNA pseudouridine746 synthase